MINKIFFHYPFACLILLASLVVGDLPYNPTRVLVPNNSSFAYLISPQSSSSQFQFSRLNISTTIEPSTLLATTPSTGLPFLTDSSAEAFIPLLNDHGDLTIFTGKCGTEKDVPQLWRLVTDGEGENGTWSQISLASLDRSLGVNFLSSGLSFSATASAKDDAMYVFGGMCPDSTTPRTPSTWTTNATYSNEMLSLTPEPSSAGASSSSVKYNLSPSASRGPPIAEAGLSITPLLPSYTNTTATTPSQQRNFVLLGGHIQQAFINMSQVALFSLPEESWAFLGVKQAAAGGKTDLMSRHASAVVEPRSGHTAVLTEDGSKIVVFGGWIGDVSTPADPQLAILEVGQEYGGTGEWAWTIPTVSNNPLKDGQGIYGHGAAMLPGGVMMIMGGYSVSSTSSKLRSRQDSQIANTHMLLFNTTSLSWVSNYTNPSSQIGPGNSPAAPSSGGALSSTSERVGLGAGMSLGFAAIVGVVAVYLLYSRRLRQNLQLREKELRDLALSADRFHSSGELLGAGVDGRGGEYPGVRTASWASRQEKYVGMSSSDGAPWAPVLGPGSIRKVEEESDDHDDGNGKRAAERTGLLVEIPSPTRGLRRGIHSRGLNGYGANLGVMGGAPSSAYGPEHGPHAPGAIHRIDEAEEDSNSEPGSVRRKKKAAVPSPLVVGTERYNDPFKDPPQIGSLPNNRSASDITRQQREREVQGWVEGWSAAAAVMDISRTGSQAHSQRPTVSSLSGSISHSGGTVSGRGSPEKSDRTESNLSERSMVSSSSIQHSALGSISRHMSMRSATTAGYHLFTSAAAAMTTRVTGTGGTSTEDAPGRGTLARAPSRRSTSLNMKSDAASRRPGTRDRSDTFSTAQTSFDPSEREALLSLGGPGSSSRQLEDDAWATPPENPSRERLHSLTGGRRALGWMGGVKRVLSGANDGGVRNRHAEFEPRSETPSPTKEGSQMMEVGQDGPNRAASVSAAFWRGKRGAKDWDEAVSHPTHPEPSSGMTGSGAVRRKPVHRHVVSGSKRPDNDQDADEEDWDVEAAVERRVVQVMFTVPKEKLRVVNADALSLLSKSDTDFDGGENDAGETGEKQKERKENRVSVVMEEAEEQEMVRERGKGKEVMKS